MAEKRSSKRHPDHQTDKNSGPSSQRGIDRHTLHMEGVPVPRASVPPSSGRIIGGAVLLAPEQEETDVMPVSQATAKSSDSSPPPSSIGGGPVSDADIEAFRGFVPSPAPESSDAVIVTSAPISEGSPTSAEDEERQNLASFVPPPPVSTRIPIPSGMLSANFGSTASSAPPGELPMAPPHFLCLTHIIN